MGMPEEFCGVREIVLKCPSGRRRGIPNITPAGFANALTIARIQQEVELYERADEYL